MVLLVFSFGGPFLDNWRFPWGVERSPRSGTQEIEKNFLSFFFRRRPSYNASWLWRLFPGVASPVKRRPEISSLT